MTTKMRIPIPWRDEIDALADEWVARVQAEKAARARCAGHLVTVAAGLYTVVS